MHNSATTFDELERTRRAERQWGPRDGEQRPVSIKAKGIGAFSTFGNTFIRQPSAVGYSGRPAFGAPISPNRSNDTRPAPAIRVFLNTMERWNIAADQRAVLLGYSAGESIVAEMILNGQRIAIGQDIRDRVSYVVATSLYLGRVLLGGAAAEQAWLSAAREEFEGRSALELMLSGRMENLLRVRDAARAEWKP